ncbi:hypothetical protein [Thiohalocapsa sp. ML1]|jgi:plasmid stabilization system protein ParE|nr:hypothetical protein [Thiohalocapsa sp. ML1]
MTRLVISAAARRDIRQALDHSARHWGVVQVIRVLHDAMDLAQALARAR